MRLGLELLHGLRKLLALLAQKIRIHSNARALHAREDGQQRNFNLSYTERGPSRSLSCGQIASCSRQVTSASSAA